MVVLTMSVRSLYGPYDCLPWMSWECPYDFGISVMIDCGGSGNVHKIDYDVLGYVED